MNPSMNNDNAIRLIIADDHPFVASAVEQLLAAESDVFVVASAGSARELVTQLERESCDIVITDFSMPVPGGVDGLPLLDTLRRRWPSVAIIVLTMVSNPGVLQTILGLGAKGLINKSDAMSELTTAVRAVARGQVYISRATRGLMESAGVPSKPTAALSPRETEVLRLFASGKTVTEIARHLNRSVKTISTQKLEAMSKLGLKSDLEIYSYARESGLLS